MNINFWPKIFNNPISHIKSLRGRLLGNISLKPPLNKDVYCPSNPAIAEISEECKIVPLSLNELFKMRSWDVTKETFDRLSQEDLQLLLSSPNSNINDFLFANEYSLLLKKGFDIISENKDYKVISIGQSFAGITELMRFRGSDTGICPISGLTYLKESDIDKIVETSDMYLQYLKNFGVDFENLSKDKIYYFIDYKYSGKTLENFEKIIKKILAKRNISADNLKFMSGDDILRKSNLYYDNFNFLSEFNFYYLCETNLKRAFSPIPKLLYSEIDDIENIMNDYFTKKRQETMIIALARLYDSMKNPQKYNFS